MNNNRFFSFFAILLPIFFSCQDRFASLEKGFQNPPDSIRTGVYWYWISGNISPEGVVKDLEAMKQAGITRAFIGHIGLEGNYPHENVKLFTDRWWETLHTALKKASELDIEIGLFNSPGWSQSGGPWVKPEQAMRYLAYSETVVDGDTVGALRATPLPAPADFFQDVKTLAIPVAADYEKDLAKTEGAKIIRNDSQFVVILPEPKTARSLKFKYKGRIDTKVSVKGGGQQKSFRIDRPYMPEIGAGIGFQPNSPVTESLPEMKSDTFVVSFDFRRGTMDSFEEIVISSTPVVERYAEKTLAKVSHRSDPAWNEYMWDEAQQYSDAAVPQPSEILDVTDKLQPDGTLLWDIPAGRWLIIRTGMALTGKTNDPAALEGKGLEIDKMSRRHAESHFDAFIGEILRRIPAEDRRTFTTVVMDSYEAGSQNFTDDFLPDFQKRYGYDAAPFLPALAGHVVGNPDMTDRFLWDMRRFIADRISYEYVGGMTAKSHEHGLKTWLENYGSWGFPGEFMQYGGQADGVGGEFWDGQGYRYECRLAASCAHTYGKRKVSAEAFTSFGPAFSRYPANFKRMGDWAMTEGVNDFILHVSVSQPSDDDFPGVNAFFGNEFNRKNTWFAHLDLFTTYLRRCCFLLQQGRNVADIAYFIGEDAPKMTGPTEPAPPDGFNFDFINAETILNSLNVKNGLLTLPNGTSYHILVLPNQETMRPELLHKIKQLAADGATIYGKMPKRSPSLADLTPDPSPKERGVSKPNRFNNPQTSLEEVFDSLKIKPDCRFIDCDAKTFLQDIAFTHRTTDDGDIYFLSNQSKKYVRFDAEFRVSGKYPELWNPSDGSIRRLQMRDGVVSIEMEADGSAFVVFRKKERKDIPLLNMPFFEKMAYLDINTPWQLTFQSDSIHRGPAETVVFDSLTDLSQNADERIKYYSGAILYKTSFTFYPLPSTFHPFPLYLELDSLVATAKVRINGKYAGGMWAKPYRVEITDFLKEGENIIEIEVVTTWLNRIIGDLRLPDEERRVKIYNDAWYRQPWTADSPLQPAGLFGTITLYGFGDCKRNY